MTMAHLDSSCTNQSATSGKAWPRALLVMAMSLVGTGVWAQAGPMDFLFGNGAPRASDTVRGSQRVWKVGEFTAIALQAVEAGNTPNQHPAKVNPDTLRNRLAGIEFNNSGRSLSLFSADELNDIVPHIVQALAAAKPGDDLYLLSTARRELGMLGLPVSITARLFMANDRLNLIVDSARQDTMSMFRSAHMIPALSFGSRSAMSPNAVAVALTSRSGEVKRGDWVQLSMADVERVETAVPAPAISPAVAAPAAAGSREPGFYDEQARRLKGLQSLRDQGLLTEAEFQAKRREILQGL
jgi:hypothetical protein